MGGIGACCWRCAAVSAWRWRRSLRRRAPAARMARARRALAAADCAASTTTAPSRYRATPRRKPKADLAPARQVRARAAVFPASFVSDRAGRRDLRLVAVRPRGTCRRRRRRREFFGALDLARDHRRFDLVRGPAVPAEHRRLGPPAAAGPHARPGRRRARSGDTAVATSICPMPICRRSSGCTRRSNMPGVPPISGACAS